MDLTLILGWMDESKCNKHYYANDSFFNHTIWNRTNAKTDNPNRRV